MNRHSIALHGALVLIASMAPTCQAQSSGFRVETDVFVDGTKEPVQQSLTLFSNGVAYDSSRDQVGETTMVDPGRDRVILLNDEHELQTTVKISELDSLMNSARKQAMTTGLGVYLRGASMVDASHDQVVVGDDLLRYTATLQRPRDDALAGQVAVQYRQFADAVKQINSFRSFGDPPFARLALNAAVQEQKALPQELTLTAKKGEHQVTYKCILHVTWMLSKTDELKIAKVGEKLALYEVVNSTEYQKRTQPQKVAGAPGAGQPQ